MICDTIEKMIWCSHSELQGYMTFAGKKMIWRTSVDENEIEWR